MILYYANVVGKKGNTLYPNKIEVKSVEDLRKAAAFDYTGIEFKDYRDSKNFVSTDCLFLDIDNVHSENPEDWVDIEMVKEYFKNIEMYVHYSRHHQISKDGATPRPKFHLIFPITKIEDPEAFTSLESANAYFSV